MKTARIAVLLALALMLLAAVPVSAAPPVFEAGGDDIDYVIFDHTICPDLEVHNHEVYTYRSTSWYDSEGNLLRQQMHFEGTDNLYNPLKPDVVLSAHFAGSAHYDARTGESNITGLVAKITVPGYGTVLLRAGRWNQWLYPDGHLAGKDSFDSEEDMEQFCSYLAGN